MGRQVKRLGAELKDSAEVIKLYCNLQRQVLSSHHQLQISTVACFETLEGWSTEFKAYCMELSRPN